MMRMALAGRRFQFWCVPLCCWLLLLLPGFTVHAVDLEWPVKSSAGRVDESLSALEQLRTLWGTVAPSSQEAVVEPDLVYEYRIAELNRRAVMPLRFHPLVKKYILTYTVERRDQVAQMLGLAGLYFPIFREALDRHQLPLELVYLAVVESALNPLAVSKSGAVGLWQFKLNTAEMFNLSVGSFVDDRMDAYLSTEAACVYLLYLYKIFDDWCLALAAYNAGPGTVQRAIERCGGERDFWKILPALPEAAQNYVPAFIAAMYVFHYAQEHHIEPLPPPIDFRSVDTVQVNQALSFGVVAEWTKVPLELLHFLNPRFRQGYIPLPDAGPVALVLPKEYMPAFVANEGRIYAQSHKVAEAPFPKANEKRIKLMHTVLQGEYLHKIALQYDCTPDEIKQWNPPDRELHPGDRLVIWVTPEFYASYSKTQDQ